MLSRRTFLLSAGAAPILASGLSVAADSQPAKLKSLSGGAKPISVEERLGRIGKAQQLMAQRKVSALLIEPGSSLEYFTGIRWHRSERTTVAMIPASGDILVVTPAFEEPSVRETLQVRGDVRDWDEHESPFERIVQGMK
jgi:Xaa-Pro dipeptidase